MATDDQPFTIHNRQPFTPSGAPFTTGAAPGTVGDACSLPPPGTDGSAEPSRSARLLAGFRSAALQLGSGAAYLTSGIRRSVSRDRLRAGFRSAAARVGAGARKLPEAMKPVLGRAAEFVWYQAPTLIGLGVAYEASTNNYLPHGPLGLFAGLGVFGLTTYAAGAVKKMLPHQQGKNQEQTQRIQARRARNPSIAKSAFGLGMVASTTLAFFPLLVNTAVEHGYLSPHSAAVGLARSDAHMLGRDPTFANGVQASHEIDNVVLVGGPVASDRSMPLYKSTDLGTDGAKSVAMANAHQTYCATYAGSGLLQIKMKVNGQIQKFYSSNDGHRASDVSANSFAACKAVLAKPPQEQRYKFNAGGYVRPRL